MTRIRQYVLVDLRPFLRAAALGLACFAAIAWSTAAWRSSAALAAASADEPPATIPDAPSPLVRPRLAYLANNSTWDLSGEQFFLFLGDVPKARLMRCPVRHISSDAKFHYYAEHRFNSEWAFERAPENDFFVKRRIWRRDQGETDWELSTDEATLAAPW